MTRTWSNLERSSKKDSSSITCYKCAKVGHIKIECPNLTKKKGKGQAKSKLDEKSQRTYGAREDVDEAYSNISIDIKHKDSDVK